MHQQGLLQAHQVKGQAIVAEDDDEEHKVDTQVQHVCHELQVEDIDALVLPAALHVRIEHGEYILEEGGGDNRSLDDILKSKQEMHTGRVRHRS